MTRGGLAPDWCLEQVREQSRVAPDAGPMSAAVVFDEPHVVRRREPAQTAVGDEAFVDGPETPLDTVYTGVLSATASRLIVPPADTTRSE